MTDTTADAPKKKSPARFITPALALVAAVGIGIFGGVLIGQNTASSATASGQGGFAGGPGGSTDGTAPTGGGQSGGFTSGSVVSVDGDTVVIESSDGTQVTITTSTDTSVTTTEESSVQSWPKATPSRSSVRPTTTATSPRRRSPRAKPASAAEWVGPRPPPTRSSRSRTPFRQAQPAGCRSLSLSRGSPTSIPLLASPHSGVVSPP